MSIRIFPNFPVGPPSVPCVDSILNGIIENYGGWASVLDSRTDIHAPLLDDLAKAGYLPDELITWRLVHHSEGRKRVVLMSACLGCNVALHDEPLARQMFEGYFHNLDEDRKAHNVSYDEIAVAAEKVRPYIQREL
jgi:hypothetical protein